MDIDAADPMDLHLDDSPNQPASAAARPIIKQGSGVWGFGGGAFSSRNGWTEQERAAHRSWDTGADRRTGAVDQPSFAFQNNESVAGACSIPAGGRLARDDLLLHRPLDGGCDGDDGARNGNPVRNEMSYEATALGMMPAASIFHPVKSAGGCGSSISGVGSSSSTANGGPVPVDDGVHIPTGTPVQHLDDPAAPSSAVASNNKHPKKKSGRPRAPKKKGKQGGAVDARPRVLRKIKRPRPPEVALGASGRDRAMAMLCSLVDSPLSDEFHKPVLHLHPEVCARSVCLCVRVSFGVRLCRVVRVLVGVLFCLLPFCTSSRLYFMLPCSTSSMLYIVGSLCSV